MSADAGTRNAPAWARGASKSRLHLRTHRVGPLILLALSIAGTVGSLRLPLGELRSPGAGMWPLLASGLLAVCAVVLLRSDLAADYEVWDIESLLVAVSVGSLAAYIKLMPILGFLISSFVLLLVWLAVFFKEKLRLALPLALGGCLAVFWLFGQVLKVPLPAGILGL